MPSVALRTEKASPVSRPTWVSLSPNSAFIGTASTFITMRSTKPTVLIAVSRTSASHGESRRIDAAMQVILSTPRGSEHGGWRGPWLALAVVRGHRARRRELGLVAFLAPGLGKRLRFPVLHRRV